VDTFVVRVGARGRLVLPRELRDRLGVKIGDKLILRVADDGSVSMVSLSQHIAHLNGLLAQPGIGRSMVDELLEERRAEAARELAELEAQTAERR
jgi:AbrB family looped-hinge helix DNA binding protein